MPRDNYPSCIWFSMSMRCSLSVPRIPEEFDWQTGREDTRKWKRPIRSILRARRPANDKQRLAHDPMGREARDMVQVDFRPACSLQKACKSLQKGYDPPVRRDMEQNGFTAGTEHRRADSKSLIGNISSDRLEKR